MSIKFRTKAFDETAKDIEYLENETGTELRKRTLDLHFGKERSEEIDGQYGVVVNGKIIDDEEILRYIIIKEDDDVLVCPILRGGDFGQIFKQVALIVVAVVASVVISPAVGGGFYGALAAAAVTVGATLALNALIPPPSVGGPGLGGLGNSQEASQMYNISGQSNQFTPYGRVPRVYGRHRVFPRVAAQPYTSIETEPGTGVLVQYFHAIYDFGYGPLTLDTIQIGDSSISQYAEVSYRLVDLNRPVVSEGPWDEALSNTFQIYKGDYNTDSSASVLNDDQGPLVPVQNYRVERNATPNPLLYEQEIILDFICPRGLIAYGTDGSTGPRTITLDIEFSKVGENIWRKYNDPSYVLSSSSAGGNSAPYDNLSLDVAHYGGSYLASSYVFILASTSRTTTVGGDVTSNVARDTIYYAAGTSEIAVFSQPRGVGEPIYDSQNVLLGTVATFFTEQVVLPFGVGLTYYRVVLNAPLTQDYVLAVTVSHYDNALFKGDPYSSYFEFLRPLSGTFFSRPFTVGRFGITAANATVAYATVRFTPREAASYKVRITRRSSTSSLSFQIVDDLTLYNIGTRFATNPITTDKRHVFMEIRIKSTNQLNGSLQNLSAVATSVLDYYDEGTGTWKKKATSNPAWVYADLMTGEVNPSPISKSRLHTPSLLEWEDFCDEVPTAPPGQVFNAKRFECNFILDYETTLQGVINSVTSAAQASLNIIDGKYGVLLDKRRDTPIQIFTPRNSWGFSSQRSYFDPPDAIKIRYVDATQDWQVREELVYANGKDEITAEKFDELSSFACTNPEQAWRWGRYMQAQAALRQEIITINVDFEYLVCTRGDYVKYVQDVMEVGGTACRVSSVAGTTVVIDEDIAIDPLEDYGYIFRGTDGVIKQGPLNVISSDTFEFLGDIPQKDNLVVIGVLGQETIDLIVKAIIPLDNLSATLTLVEKADAVYDAESTSFVPDYNPQFNVSVEGQTAPGPVLDLEIIENTWRVMNRGYQYYMQLDWDTPGIGAVDVYEVYLDYGNGYDLVDVTKDSFYEYIVNEANLGLLHKFKVLGVSANGDKISLVEAEEVADTPIKKVTPPSDVLALYLNVTNEVLQINWPAVTDPDISEYLIRYNPTADGTWETSIPLLRIDRSSTLASTQARTGTYLIKALDFNNNESLLAARAKTAIPELFNLNIIEQTNDFPDLFGSLDRVVKDGNSLILEASQPHPEDPALNEYYSEGFYYYEEFLDLGDIYSVRLQSNIEAEGFTVGDVMGNWITLDQVLALSGSKFSEWDVETQVRYTNNFNVMSDWDLLSNVESLSEGEEDDWTGWKSFTIGDFTGRIFQFRLRLISNKPSVTPRVFDGVIKADMPDRIWRANNLMSNAGATDVYYDPPFKGPGTSPNIQITQDNMQLGDRFVITDKSLSKFTITFYDSSNTPVVRQFDVAALGYGRKQNSVS